MIFEHHFLYMFFTHISCCLLLFYISVCYTAGLMKHLPSPASLAALMSVVAASPSARFAGFTYRAKESGELARHTVILGADYGKLVSDSMIAIRANGDEDFDSDIAITSMRQGYVKACAVGSRERKDANAMLAFAQAAMGAERAAAAELYISLADTQLAHAQGEQNAAYTKAGLYEAVCAGITRNLSDGSYEVSGLAHAKVVLEAGTFKEVASSAKTLAKAALRRSLPIGKWRTFCLEANCLEGIRANGDTLEFA
jgi:hypothetical protein